MATAAKASSGLTWPRAASARMSRGASTRATSAPPSHQDRRSTCTSGGSSPSGARVIRASTCGRVRNRPPDTAIRASPPSSAKARGWKPAASRAAKTRVAKPSSPSDRAARPGTGGGAESGITGIRFGSRRRESRASRSVPFTKASPASTHSLDHCSPPFSCERARPRSPVVRPG